MHRSPWWLAALAAAVVSAVAASPASADTYTVFSCKGPTGTANGAAGWAALPAASGVGHATSACPQSGPLTAAIDLDPAGQASASWRFTAPTDTSIVSFAAQRRTTGVGTPTKSKDVSYVLETNNSNLELCDVSLNSSCTKDLTDPISKQGLTAAWVQFRVLCSDTGVGCSRPLRADFDAIQVGLKDAAAPTVSGARVIDNGDTSGVLTVGFNAADNGGGVYRAVVSVDGKPAATQALGGADCADANPTNADPYEFLVPVPCPPAVNDAVVKLNYRSLPAGPHGVEIAVEDAAGNTMSVFGPVQFPRLNTENAPSTPAAVKRLLNAKLKVYFAKNRTKAFSSIYGNRVVTRGILRDSRGKGVRGARIDVYHRLRSTGKRRLLKTGLKTRADGRLTLILPLNVDSRSIEYDFRAVRPGKITSQQIIKLNVMRNGRTFIRKLKSRT